MMKRSRETYPVLLILIILLMGITGRDVVAGPSDASLPDTIFAGTLRIGACNSLSFPVLNAGGGPMQIESIELTEGADHFSITPLASPLHLDSGDRASIDLRFCAGDVVGCFSGRLRLRVSDGSGGEVPLEFDIGLGICAGVPVLEVSPDRVSFPPLDAGLCDTLDVTLRNAGSYPLSIETVTFDGGIDFSVALPPVPLLLLPDESHVLSLVFCPLTARPLGDTLRLWSDGIAPEIALYVEGRGTDPRSPVIDVFDVGPVIIGSRLDTFLVIRNYDEFDPLRIVARDILPHAGSFSIGTTLPSGDLIILPGDSLRLPISFHPVEGGKHSEEIHLEYTGRNASVTTLVGWSIIPGIRLDTARGNAGEILSLHAFLDRPPEARYSSIPFRVLIRISPSALSPQGIYSGAGGSTVMAYGPDGVMDIQGTSGTDSLLFGIELRGLSTGQAKNEVCIEEVDRSSGVPMNINGHGLVRLDGCDIGRSDSGVAKFLFLRAGPNPSSGHLSISYYVPTATKAKLSIYDNTGEIILSMVPATNGAGIGSFGITEGELRPGVYHVELRAERQRAVTRVVVR